MAEIHLFRGKARNLLEHCAQHANGIRKLCDLIDDAVRRGDLTDAMSLSISGSASALASSLALNLSDRQTVAAMRELLAVGQRLAAGSSRPEHADLVAGIDERLAALERGPFHAKPNQKPGDNHVR